MPSSFDLQLSRKRGCDRGPIPAMHAPSSKPLSYWSKETLRYASNKPKQSVANIPCRQRMQSTLNAILGAAQLVAGCFMAWKAISLCTGTPYPMMVVTTGSMLPAFAPGDVLFVSNHQQNVAVGDLPVCWLPGSAFPMVHRVHRVTYAHSQSNL